MALQDAIDLVERSARSARGAMGGLGEAVRTTGVAMRWGAAMARGEVRHGFDVVRSGARSAAGGVRIMGSALRWGGAIAKGEMRLGLAAVRSGLDRAITPIANFGRRIGGTVESMGKLTKSTMSTLAVFGQIPGVMQAMNFAASLGASGARFAADAFSFKEATTFGFEILTRSASKAQEMMGFSDELARSLGKSTSEVGSGVRDLLAKGFDTQMIRQIVSGMADLSTINPDANVKLLTMAVGQVKSKGFLMMEELRGQIAEQGLDIQSVYKHIAQNLGIAQGDVEKAISGKKVTADLGITSILQAIQDMGGGGDLGAVSAAKAVRTVGGAFENAKAQAERMLLAVNTGPVGSKLITLAGRVSNLFDPTSNSGRKLLGVLDQGANRLASFVEGVSLDDLSSGFDGATSAARSFIGVAGGLGGGFFQGMREASQTVNEVKASLGLASGSANETSSAFRGIGMAVGYVVVGLSTVASIIGVIPKAFAEVPDSMRMIGADIARGIGEGLESAKMSLLGKMQDIANLLPESVRKLLKIQSPSRVMMALGAHTTAGLVAGLDKGPSPADRMRDLVAPPPIKRPSVPMPRIDNAAGGRGGAGGAQFSINLGGVTIIAQGVQNMDQLLDQAEPTLRRRLQALFEEEAIAAGLAPT